MIEHRTLVSTFCDYIIENGSEQMKESLRLINRKNYEKRAKLAIYLFLYAMTFNPPQH